MAEILFIKPVNSTFVCTDEEFLNKQYTVKSFHYAAVSGKGHLVYQIKLFLWILWHIWQCKVVFIWFADYHGFLPTLFARIFHKKRITVIAGYDVAAEKEYDYGVFLYKIRGYCAKFTLKYASYVFSVSQALIQDLYTHVPDTKAIVKHIPFGFDSEKWKPNFLIQKKAVLTISVTDTHKRMKIKGIDVLIEVAKLLPDIPFTIAGVKENMYEYLTQIKSDNVTLIPTLPPEKIIELCQSHSVYAQLSVREGLPNAVCEAMLCGCIPVGTKRGGIPEAIGDAGYIIDSRNPQDIAPIIRKAVKNPDYTPQKAREYIIQNYPKERRENAFLEVLSEIVRKQNN